jgi:hypothetical protein
MTCSTGVRFNSVLLFGLKQKKWRCSVNQALQTTEAASAEKNESPRDGKLHGALSHLPGIDQALTDDLH